MAILCFERRFSKQNRVIRLKSNILPTPNFWAGYATVHRNRNVDRGHPASEFRDEGDFSNIWQLSLIAGSLL